MRNLNSHTRPKRRSVYQGFTLIELVVTMAVFLVLGLAATNLAKQSVGVSISQQAQSALNIAIRNAATQMQIDLTNAGTGYFPTYNIPGAPLGVVISNMSTGYDKLTILSFDPTIVAHPTATANTTYSASGTATMNVTPVGISANALQAGYTSGSILMMFSNTVNASSGMPYITTFPVTNASVSGSTVNITFTSNSYPVAGTPGTGTWPGDPLGVSSTYGISDPILNADGTTSPGICYLSTGANNASDPAPPYDNTDWLLKTSSIIYYVDHASTNLYRQVNNGTLQVIATNIMGFKVGAMVYNNVSTSDSSSYTYLPAGTINDFRKIRSLRISLIERTTPDPSSPFRNSFDGGPYKVEGTSFIINPRNLSLHD